MTYAEVLDWSEYIRCRGSLNTNMNLERGFALVAQMINNALGGKKQMSDFMPHFPNEDDIEIPLEQAMELWQ